MCTSNRHPILWRNRALGLAVGVVSLLGIALATLGPGPGEVGGVARWTLSDVGLNIALFLPLGVGLALGGLGVWQAIAIGILCSSAVELAQLWWVPGRFASVLDVASNALGTAAGAAAVVRWDARARWWPWVGRLLATLVVLAWLLAGYVAQPAIPSSPDWFVESAPLALAGRHSGWETLEVQLQHRPLSPGWLPDAEALRAQLMASRRTLFRVRFVWGDPSAEPVPIAQVVIGERRNRFLTLEQRGGRLRGYQRTGLWWVGLRTPWIELPAEFRPSKGDTVEAMLVANRHVITLEGTVLGSTVSSRLRLSPELYFAAQWNRASGGAFWWWIVPGMLSFFVLGLALARRWWLLVVWGAVSLVLSAVSAGCALPAVGMFAAAIVGASGGVRGARALGLAGSTTAGGGEP